MIRLSIIPSHMSTAVFSTCDVKFWRFAISTFLTLPKQLILVYLGVLLVQEQDDSTIKDALFAVAGLVTVAAAVWIWFKMKKYKKQLLEEQEERHQRKEDDRLALTRSDSGYAADGNAPNYPLAGQEGVPMPMPMPMPVPTEISTSFSPTLSYGGWRRENVLGSPVAAVQQPELPRYEPYRPQYQSPTTQYGPYGHYEQDTAYHGADDSGDVGTALTHSGVYGLPGPTTPLTRPVDDNISVENGRPAQNHHFV